MRDISTAIHIEQLENFYEWTWKIWRTMKERYSYFEDRLPRFSKFVGKVARTAKKGGKWNKWHPNIFGEISIDIRNIFWASLHIYMTELESNEAQSQVWKLSVADCSWSRENFGKLIEKVAANWERIQCRLYLQDSFDKELCHCWIPFAKLPRLLSWWIQPFSRFGTWVFRGKLGPIWVWKENSGHYLSYDILQHALMKQFSTKWQWLKFSFT